MDEQQRAQGRSFWSLGHYPTMAENWAEMGPDLVARIGVGAGDEVLDVGCGHGNTALAAARAGAARVVGIDLTPDLLAFARGRSAAEGFDVEWLEGDAEDLPFDDASFDVVTSTLAVIFAPHPEQAMAELSRVCRPGGRVAITAWTDDSWGAALRDALQSLLPPAAEPGHLGWGDTATAVARFASAGLHATVERRTLVMHAPSAAAHIASVTSVAAPFIATLDVLDAQGIGAEARASMVAAATRIGRTTDAGWEADADYFEITATKG